MVCPTKPVMVKFFVTESFPGSPLPFNVTAMVGRLASLLTIVAVAVSIMPLGVKVMVSVCSFPGSTLKEPGVTLKTEADDGGLMVKFPIRFPLVLFPEFLIVKFLVDD